MQQKARPLDYLPPVLQLLMSNMPSKLNKKLLAGFLRDIMPELRRQAEWTRDNDEAVYNAASNASPGLEINAAAGLDPFSPFGKCSDLDCRLLNARQIARTMGLYSDVALVGDPFTAAMLSTRKWTHDHSTRLLADLVVFCELQPLFEAGIFRFVTPFTSFCTSCWDKFDERLAGVVKEVLPVVLPNFAFEIKHGWLDICQDDNIGPRIHHRFKIKPAELARLHTPSDVTDFGQRYLSRILRDEVSEALLRMRRDASPHSVTFSNSRISVLVARRFDTNDGNGNVEMWEQDRSVNLPWVGDLTPRQILTLRQDAHRALPRFRERMGRALTNESPADAANIVRDLKEEAAEVKAELDALNIPAEQKFRGLSSILGMTISVYGFAAEFVPVGAALTGLATLLGLLHTADQNERKEAAKLKSRPGYVLVKAKELAQHSS